jgi:uridylate kinase
LRKFGKKTKSQSLEGIAVTRLHAGFMARFFGKKANEVIPESMKKVKDLLRGNQIVFCGGLRYRAENTTDGTAAKLAAYLDCPFINLTNVKGLYTADPRKDKKAKFIGKISWKEFNKITEKIKYEAGQHFVLDKVASETILKERIPTYIVGNLKAIENVIKGKKFEGTEIRG